jgi:regulator of protease activity HflC (stomatin/prohibitin superfamily)
MAKWPNPEAKLRTAAGEGKHESWLIQWIDSILPGGMRWVGVPWTYSIYEYNFRWRVLRESKPLDTEDSLVEAIQLESKKWAVSFAKVLDYVFLRDTVYYFRVSKAETQGADNSAEDKSVGMAIAADLLATVRVVNPYSIFFVVHDWLESSLDLVRPSIRSWIANKPYQEINRKTESAQRTFDEFLKNAPKEDGDEYIIAYLEETYGVRYKRIAFDTVIPPDEYAAATTKRAAAVQEAVITVTVAGANAKRALIAAEAAKQVAILEAEGKAAGIERLTVAVRDGGETALNIMAFETYAGIGANGNAVYVLGGGSTPAPVQMLLPPPPKNANATPPQPPPPGSNKPANRGRRP